MNRILCGALAISCLASCAPAAAPPPATPGPAAPSPPPPAVALKPPLDTLAFYVGTWQCKGTSFVTSEQPKEEKWDATVKVAPELDGTWLSVQMIGPDMNRTIEHKGYDPAAKRWVHLAVFNEGGWSILASPGWDGNHMTFTPEDKSDKSRGTFTKLSETSYSHGVTRDTDKGVEKVWEKICNKMGG